MTEEDWTQGQPLTLGVFLNGETIPTPDDHGRRIVDDSFLVLFNAREDEMEWRVPHERFGRRWRVMIDTATGFACHGVGAEVDATSPLPVEGRTVVVLQRRDEP